VYTRVYTTIRHHAAGGKSSQELPPRRWLRVMRGTHVT
jgi:hypothetical protein